MCIICPTPAHALTDPHHSVPGTYSVAVIVYYNKQFKLSTGLFGIDYDQTVFTTAALEKLRGGWITSMTFFKYMDTCSSTWYSCDEGQWDPQ